jgi:hypothetical protein
MPAPLFRIEISPSDLKRPSTAILILANLVPFFGVIFLGWEIFPILFLFWTENVIVGLFNIFKMALVSSRDLGQHTAKISTILFFCVHYGMFTLVHGLFVFVVFGMESENSLGIDTLSQTIRDSQLIWGVLALAGSHGISFVINYLGKQEYKRATLSALMTEPYSRVVILHLTIIFGGMLLSILGSPIFGLLLLIVLKIGIDIIAHLKQHAGAPAPPDV